jgi:exosome complex exonuclease DIS3/RRP44
MAQMASRASIDYFVGLAIKGKIEASAKAGQGDCIVEEAFVIRTFRNGLGVFVSK